MYSREIGIFNRFPKFTNALSIQVCDNNLLKEVLNMSNILKNKVFIKGASGKMSPVIPNLHQGSDTLSLR